MLDWLFGKRKEVDSEQTLSDIIRGIAHAASTANEVADQQFLRQCEMFFDRSDNTMSPKMIDVQLPDGRKMPVPVITLMDPSTLALESLEVKMKVRLTESQIKSIKDDLTRSSFVVSMSGTDGGDSIAVTMNFKRQAPTEAVSRVIDELQNSVVPRSS